MTTFDARPQASSATRPPSWLSSALMDGYAHDGDAIFPFHEFSAFEPGCVAMARRFVGHTLGSWGAERAAFDTTLVVSELVTNAMRHGGGALQLRLLRHGPEVACVVTDYSPAPPSPAGADVFAEYGRGLRLVEALCAAWGWVVPGGPRKLVWAVLAP
ncbi:ATP-binding protein [Nonomuraea sp. SBT364]|uniref:ATP-binding protein n=1 Tax=Nonomuraea sp. SBT364 TaxID=1580530 RepID=UPI00069DC82B|nr:ATP-binding protein [Nonomuraea sp. SBT364]